MSVKSKDEILSSIKAKLGEDTSDEAIALIEDVSDTFDDLSKSSNSDGIDWQKKYEENDKKWREKYRDRFFNSTADDPEDDPEDDENEPEPEVKKMTYEDLFKELK